MNTDMRLLRLLIDRPWDIEVIQEEYDKSLMCRYQRPKVYINGLYEGEVVTLIQNLLDTQEEYKAKLEEYEYKIKGIKGFINSI